MWRCDDIMSHPRLGIPTMSNFVLLSGKVRLTPCVYRGESFLLSESDLVTTCMYKRTAHCGTVQRSRAVVAKARVQPH
jgi:hypothetical protein